MAEGEVIEEGEGVSEKKGVRRCSKAHALIIPCVRACMRACVCACVRCLRVGMRVCVRALTRARTVPAASSLPPPFSHDLDSGPHYPPPPPPKLNPNPPVLTLALALPPLYHVAGRTQKRFERGRGRVGLSGGGGEGGDEVCSQTQASMAKERGQSGG